MKIAQKKIEEIEKHIAVHGKKLAKKLLIWLLRRAINLDREIWCYLPSELNAIKSDLESMFDVANKSMKDLGLVFSIKSGRYIGRGSWCGYSIFLVRRETEKAIEQKTKLKIRNLRFNLRAIKAIKLV